MQYKTWDEWKEEGKYVIKGEKSHKRIEGVCVFSENQVISLEEIRARQRIVKELLVEERKRREKEHKHIREDAYKGECGCMIDKDEALNWLATSGALIFSDQHDVSISTLDVRDMVFGLDDE